MAKYLLKRILHGLVSVVIVVSIVMLLLYSLMDKSFIFIGDGDYTKKQSTQKLTYQYEMWERYGYLDYVSFTEYISGLEASGEIDEETRKAVKLGETEDKDSDLTKVYIQKFTDYYKSKGYTVERKDGETILRKRYAALLFAYKNIPVYERILPYFASIFQVDNIHYVEKTTGEKLENTGLTFTLYDPLYNYNEENPDEPLHKVFSPAIIGNGTQHKYLLYFDDVFPYVHQNLVTIHLGESYSVSKGVDISKTLTTRQDPNRSVTVTFPTGLTEESPRNLHTATYQAPTANQLKNTTDRFNDNYTEVENFKSNFSRTGFSFVIGLISVIAAYIIGVPLGILMARKKDTFVDKLGTLYVIFIIAVPSLAYIFMFREIGGMLGLPKTFVLDPGAGVTKWTTTLMYVLPIVSLALPSIANLMKWMRRYMIDQQNSDYVKFARSGGLSEGAIFRKHILKNAVIPIVHGIPGSILGSLVGAIITERIYMVPGAGYLLTESIARYDNSAIVGLTLFYAVLSIVSLILGDILMSIVDPRISFTEKAR